MRTLVRTTLGLGSALLCSALMAAPPLRVIVPISPGSTQDFVARSLSDALGKQLDRPVFVENLPGAGGVTGTAQMVRAKPDGNTVAVVGSSHVINPNVIKSLPFDALADVTPITVAGSVPLILVVHPSLPARDLPKFLALLRKEPGKYNYASAGNGSITHLASALLLKEAGLQAQHVPYNGVAPQVVGMIAGETQFSFVTVTQAAALIKDGKLRGLAVSSSAPTPLLPELPPLAQAGVPGYGIEAWIAFIGPAGLPDAAVQQIYQAVRSGLAHDATRALFAKQDFNTIGSTPAETRALFAREAEKYRAVAIQAGVTPQ